MLTVVQRVRVEWGHCDPARIIFNPNYYIWMDQNTHALLAEAGFNLATEILDPAVRGFPLVSSGAEFFAPAYYGDVLELRSQVGKLGNTSFVVEHRFTRADTLLCSGSETRVWARSDSEDAMKMRAVRVPDAIRQALGSNTEVNLK